MADRYAVATGNWSDVATWDGGSTLPGASDDVYADGYTVTVDQDVSVLSLRTTRRAGGTAGGQFSITANDRTVVGDVICGPATGAAVSWSGTGTLTITGNLTGGTSGNTLTAVTMTGVGAILTVVGNINGGSAINAAGVYCAASGQSVLVTGDVTGGSSNGGSHGTAGIAAVSSGAGAAIVVTGNVTGGTNAFAPGILGGGSITVNGNLLSNVGAAIASVAKVEVNGELQTTATDQLPIQSASLGAYFGKACFTSSTIYRGKDSGGSELTLSAAGTDQADTADVRSGTTYNHGASVGTLAVPDPSYVSLGVPTDNTVGTYAVTPATVAAAVCDELLSSHTTAGSLGKTLSDILEDTGTTLPAAIAAGGITPAQVKAQCDQAIADAALATAASVDALNDLDFAGVWTTQLSESYAADGAAPTPAQVLFLIQQAVTEFAISGTVLTVKRLDKSTQAAQYTLDDAEAPSSRTRSA